MCRNDSVSAVVRLAVGVSLTLGVTLAQPAPQPPDWRKVGGSSVELALAAPATGPVDAVWYAADGTRLYARTRSGRVYETQDFETWTPATAPARPDGTTPASAERLPDAGAALVAFPQYPGRVYGLGGQLYRSDDGGRSWTNLTAFRSASVIGGRQRGVAVSPSDPDQVVVANDYGVWRSMDGGLSWSGLNDFLPNLPPGRILETPRGTAGARIYVDNLGALELPPGGLVWRPVPDTALQREARALSAYSAALGANISAAASSGETVYAGSADGRLWVSFDSGRTWRGPSPATGGAVERIWVDATQPRIALAVLEGPGARVLRTTNSGAFWDDLTADLPPGAVRGVTAERASGALYVATERGIFYARADLESAALPQASWTPIAGSLPVAAATDIRLDAAGNQLYVALEGYGLYAAMAPHRAAALRLVNAADFSGRPAAPGGLLSVLGGRVSSARAGGLLFPVLAASGDASQIQVPFEASGPQVSLAVETGGGPAMRFPVTLQPVSPAIFVSRDGSPMLLDADSGMMLEGLNTVRSGARIQVLTTGLGRVRPEWPTGVAAPLQNPPAVAAEVRAYIDRVAVPVTRAVLAPGYIGFYLVELQIPAIVNAGPAELYVAAGTQESNRVRITLEP
ncbi:MAG TPA: hypothetical protein VN442_26995 [Bryobacteraceae bacterium]|nr:hypothetical protein [Bryobacteraceae bacterium]